MRGGVTFLGVELRSRSVLASGILGVTLASLRRVYREGAGAVTTKSVGPSPRRGHHAPVVFDWGHGLVNAVGLSNPGVERFLAEWKDAVVDFPLILSVFGGVEEDFPHVAGSLDALGHSFLELNISCPNVLDEFGTPFSFSPDLTRRITRSVRDVTSKPLIVKLSPNTPLVKQVGRAAEEGGADALCVMNTVGPGMVIDLATASPLLGNMVGGISGPAVFPITVRHVWDLAGEVRIPIIGVGGVETSREAIALLMAGAELFGVGSALYGSGPSVFARIDEGIAEFLAANGMDDQRELVGLARRRGGKSYFRVPDGPGTMRPSRGDMRFRVLPAHEIRCREGGAARTLLFEWVQSDLSDSDLGTPLPKPGQFYMLWLPGVDQKPYSVSFLEGGLIGFSLQERGAFSRALAEVREGDPVGLLGPLGRSFDLERNGPYLLVGGGIGLAPLAFAADRLASRGTPLCIAAGGKTSVSLEWFWDLLSSRAGVRAGAGCFDASGLRSDAPDREFEIFCCTDDGSCGAEGILTDHLERVIERVKPRFALVCGPETFMRRAIEVFLRAGVEGQASIERMMKCGVGICGSCSLDDTGDRVCMEGPVFDFDYLSASSEFGRYDRDESGTRRPIG